MQSWNRGVKRSIPVIMGYIPLGIACGLLLRSAGLSPLQVGAMSALVFGGSAQFTAAALLMARAGGVEIILTMLLLNARQMLYSISFITHIKQEPNWKIALLTNFTADESYALNIVRFQESERKNQKWTIDDAMACAITSYLVWVIATFVGACVGEWLQFPNVVMNFIMAAMFIGLLIPQLKTRLLISVTLLSGLLALFLQCFLPNSVVILLVTLLASIVGYWLEKRQQHLLKDGG